MLAILVVAMVLEPDLQGSGTHRQLGLAACSLMATTGLPCPTCGMTTSFAWFSHGRWISSLVVQPFGFVLALICAMTFWAGLYVAVTGRPTHRLLRLIPIRWWLVPLVTMFVLAWAWRLFFAFSSRPLPA
jgi:hypothetical protein